MRLRIPGGLVLAAVAALVVVACLYIGPCDDPYHGAAATPYHGIMRHSPQCSECKAIDALWRQPMTPEQADAIAKATRAHAQAEKAAGRWTVHPSLRQP